MTARALTYAEAGVDIGAAEENVRRIAEHVRSTHGPRVLGTFGAFAGLFHLRDLRDPVLVASTDGVGSKLQLGIQLDQHEVVGRDLVNLSVNDVLTTGAKPLFFLDYVAVHQLDHEVMERLVGGMASACRENGCALLGGETAQLPDLYRPEQYDLAGFVVGAVERDQVINGSSVRPGDRVWALPSSGLHTNGYSLARHVIDASGLDLNAKPEALKGVSVGEALLQPHLSYLGALAPLLERPGTIKAMAHITGGGLEGNLPRVLPEAVAAEVTWGAWAIPPIFGVLQDAGRLEFGEMMRVFNMGLGMAFVTADDVDAKAACSGAQEIGQIVDRSDDERVLLRGAPSR